MMRNVLGISYSYENTFFSFSGLKGQTKVGRDGLHYFSKRVTLVFSGLEKSFMDKLIERFFFFPEIRLGDLILAPEYVEQEHHEPLGKEVRYLCISPLVVYHGTSISKNKEFIHPTTDVFSDLLYESTILRMERSGIFKPYEISSLFKFQLSPDIQYLERIQLSEKKFARIYSTIYKNEIKEIRGYTFPFTLYADPIVQEFVYCNGFGELTQNGFGLLDLAESSLVKREIYYGKPDEETDYSSLEDTRFNKL
ncbi:MAG: CRISPR-associated protein Cas6 [Cytophagales bacterium]|nr:CRISPR-associated protein Cas6 [Cytophagales bacterium]MDW8384436.1 CRISPR-associated endoribonuclease Cas6 [Flammeovirgaceae bacterium]